MKKFYRVLVSRKGFKPEKGIIFLVRGEKFLLLESGNGLFVKDLLQEYVISRFDDLKVKIGKHEIDRGLLEKFSIPTVFGKVWSEELNNWVNF